MMAINIWPLWASDKAWANQNGTHETRAQGFRRWNDDLLQHIYQDTENRWAELLLRLDEQSDSIQNAVKDELDNLGRLMRGIRHRLSWMEARTELMLSMLSNTTSFADVAKAQEAWDHLPSARKVSHSSSRLEVRPHLSVPVELFPTHIWDYRIQRLRGSCDFHDRHYHAAYLSWLCQGIWPGNGGADARHHGFPDGTTGYRPVQPWLCHYRIESRDRSKGWQYQQPPNWDVRRNRPPSGDGHRRRGTRGVQKPPRRFAKGRGDHCDCERWFAEFAASGYDCEDSGEELGLDRMKYFAWLLDDRRIFNVIADRGSNHFGSALCPLGLG